LEVSLCTLENDWLSVNFADHFASVCEVRSVGDVESDTNFVTDGLASEGRCNLSVFVSPERYDVTCVGDDFGEESHALFGWHGLVGHVDDFAKGDS